MAKLQVIRFFTDGLTGEKCGVVWDGENEVCVSEEDAWHIEAMAQAEHDDYMLRLEQGV